MRLEARGFWRRIPPFEELATPSEGSLNDIKSLADDYEIRLLLFFDGSRKLTGIYQTGEVYAPGHLQFQGIADRLKLVAWKGQHGHITEQAFNRLINNGRKEGSHARCNR